MLGPIIAGNMAQYTSWRWFFWACTVAQAITTISLVFLFPETRRSTFSRSQPTSLPVDSAAVNIDKSSGSPNVDFAHTESQTVATQLGHGKPTRSQFSMLPSIDRQCLSTVGYHILGPFQLFCFPIVFWVAMAMGSAANALLCVNLLQSQALSASPYNFSPANVGFANFALAVGALIGLLCSGPISDWVAARATTRNGGIREAEMRLPALIPFIIVAIVGMVTLGVGWQKHWPWEAIIIFGFTCVGIIAVSIPTITITVSVDLLHKLLDPDSPH